MNPHHLHKATSASSLTQADSSSNNSNKSSSSRKKRLLSRLGFRNTASSSTSSPAAASTISEPFRIVHGPDLIPAYSPRRPTAPRTPSEVEDALEEMFAHTSSQGRRPSTAPEFEGRDVPLRSHTMPEQRRPPIPPPKDGLLPPRSFPVRTPLNTNIPPPPPPPPRTAGARLESIPASPLSPAAIRSNPTPTAGAYGLFPLTPGTPRIVESNRFQRSMTGDSNFHAPRPLSERPLIPMSPGTPRMPRRDDTVLTPRGPLSLSAPLTSSPVRMQPRAETQVRPRPRDRRHSPLSPLGQSPPMMLSPSRLTYTSMDETVAPRRPPIPEISTERRPSRSNVPDTPLTARPWLPHQLIGIDSTRADNGADSSDDDESTPSVTTARNPPPAQRLEQELPVLPQGPHQAKCQLCSAPCFPSQRLCTSCTEHSRPHNLDFDDSSDESDYEDIVPHSRTPSLSPQKKPKPLSIQTTPQNSSAFTASPMPITPGRPHASFSRPRTPTRSPLRADTPHSSSPRTPETPRVWSRSHTHQPETDSIRSLSISPGTSHVAQQLQVLSSPTPRKVSVGSPVLQQRGSAIYHLERSMQRENWSPLTAGATPGNGYDVVRVSSGAARKVKVMRDSNDENADTMKMLADEEAPEGERRWEGGGGGYGDWFSYYAEEERREAEEDEEEEERRSSMGSSIYERIQSIYDAYGGTDEEEEGAGMI